MTSTADIICIIDRSGSMASIKSDAIGGFNEMLREQKAQPGTAKLTLALFDHEFQLVHERRPLPEVPDLNDETYVPRGTTALHDAIGKMLNKAREFAPDGPDHKFIVVILTDGMENASLEWKREGVKALTDELTAKSWEFIYLAANQDAFAVGAAMGVANAMTASFTADSIGTQSAYRGATASMNTIRNSPSKAK